MTSTLPILVGIIGLFLVFGGAVAIWATDRSFLPQSRQCPRCRHSWTSRAIYCPRCITAAGRSIDDGTEHRWPGHDWQGHMQTQPIPIVKEPTC